MGFSCIYHLGYIFDEPPTFQYLHVTLNKLGWMRGKFGNGAD